MGYGKFNTTMRGKETLVRTAVRFVDRCHELSSNMLGLPVVITINDSIVKPLTRLVGNSSSVGVTVCPLIP